jgi:hypothetical protein
MTIASHPMRIALAAMLALIAATAATPAQADPYRWCAQYGGFRGSTSNCGFVTLEQCRATISGIGGSCVPNPFYDGVPFGESRPVQRAKKKKSPE